MTNRPPWAQRLASAWARHATSASRSLTQRHHTERVIQRVRWFAALLAAGLTVRLTGGPDGALWVVSALLLGNVVSTEHLLRRPPNEVLLRTIGVVSFAVDVLATTITLAALSQDPSDPVVALTTMLALQAAVRWQVVGGVLGGLLGGGLGTLWTVVAHRTAFGSLPPPEQLLFRTPTVVLISVLVGGVVRQLDRERHRAQHVLDLSRELILTVASDDRITSANEATWSLLGVPPHALIGRRWASLVTGDHAGTIAAAAGSGDALLQQQLRHLDGSAVWLEISIRTDTAEGLRYVVARDITARLATEQQRSISEQRYRALFSHNADAVFGFDTDGRIVDVNPAAEDLFRRTRQDLIGMAGLALIDAGSRADARAALDRALHGETQDLEVVLAFPDTGTGHADVDLLPIAVDGEVVGVFGMARDVTERTRREAQLEYRASHDLLTGLANRARLLQRMQALLAADEPVGLLFLDLDEFKPVNDRFGHAVGDQVLVTVARRLRSMVRDSELVCRLGGDEFCVLLTPCDATTIQRLGERAAHVVSQPVTIRAGTVAVMASIGAAVARPGESPSELMARADAAMYTVKGHRKLGDEPASSPGVLLAS